MLELLYDMRRLFSASIRRIINSWVLNDAPATTHSGIRFIDASDADNPAANFDRLKEACELLEYYDVYRFQQLRRFIRTIVVEDDLPARAVYFIGTSTCAVTRKLLSETTASIAAALVHETAHSRIDHMHVRQLGGRLARIEQICMKEEVEFVRHFPRSPELDDWIAERMKEVSAYGAKAKSNK